MQKSLAIALGLALALGSTAQAQSIGDNARQRFERSSGGNINEYIRNLDSDDPIERIAAVKSLGDSNDEKALEYLIQAVGDPDIRVQAKAIEMLGRMRASEATPVLVQHLFLRTTEEKLKRRLLAALAEIGDLDAAPSILEFLERDLDATTRGTAIYALGDIGAPNSEEPLREIAANEANATLQRLAREALAKVQQHQAVRLKEVSAPVDTFLNPEGPPGAR